MPPLSLVRLDANGLVSLDLLLQERSVTGAARRQGVTQSAMSQTLRRLREALGDDLLVRSGSEMVLTPRAVALREPLRRIFAELERVIAEEPAFDPATSTRRVRLAVSDYAAVLVLPRLLARISAEAPDIEVAVVTPTSRTSDAVRDGDVDMAVGFLADSPGLDTEELWSDDFALLVRRGHPLARQRDRLGAFSRARHLLVSPRGTPRGRVDDVLAELGRSRRVSVTLPFFLAAPAIVADTDLVLTIPRKIAVRFAKIYDLVLREPPVSVGSFSIEMATASRLRADPANRWLRELVMSVARAV